MQGTRMQVCRDAGCKMHGCRCAGCRDAGCRCACADVQGCRVQVCRGAGAGCPAAAELVLAAGAAARGGSVGCQGAGAGRAGWGSRKGSPAPLPSPREGSEYTQTLWSLPCKSWQDPASSELIHVRSPAGSGHLRGWGRAGISAGTLPWGGAHELGAEIRAQPIPSSSSSSRSLLQQHGDCGHAQLSPASASQQRPTVLPSQGV